jgi:dTDP-glucose 4,6-dehydratase
MIQRFLITGGAGFIGSALTRYVIERTPCSALVLDKLTYAANYDSLLSVADNPRFSFIAGDIADRDLVDRLLSDYRPHAIVHLAAETHVDRSIDGPMAFVQNNIVGTAVLLEAALKYWRKLPGALPIAFRFHHVSTDEVYGSLNGDGFFTEDTAYDPRSPYSASKAAADHLVSAWGHTYGLPVIISNSSNTFGPWQFPEKLIPLMVIKALQTERLPVYGDGGNVRDWMFVDDHASALFAIATQGRPGERYCLGAKCQKSNIEVVKLLCSILDQLAPKPFPHESLIAFVADRPGHDRKYAIDPTKVMREFKWTPQDDFALSLRKTVAWYLENDRWWSRILQNEYGGERLGLFTAQL